MRLTPFIWGNGRMTKEPLNKSLCVVSLYILLLPTVALFMGRGQDDVLTLTGVGVIVALIVRPPDILRLKAFGIEVELQTRTGEVNPTVAQLEELALAIAVPTLTNLAVQGYFIELRNSDRYTMREEMLGFLRGVGLDPEAIARVDGVFSRTFRQRLVASASWRGPWGASRSSRRRNVGARPCATARKPRAPTKSRGFWSKEGE